MLKKIGQILSAIVYSFLFSMLMYAICVWPVAWLISLDTKILLLIAIFGGGVIYGVLAVLKTLIILPYTWIVKENFAALVISVGIILIHAIRYIVYLVPSLFGNGVGVFGVTLIMLIELVWMAFMTITAIISGYES